MDGHESHHSTDFELFCKDHKIITVYMPAHSSHILQPLDVGCFGPLKRAYGQEIEMFMKAHITHITKTDFLPALFAANQAAMTGKIIKGAFRGAGLVPFDPESVLSRLDVQLRTPSPVEGDVESRLEIDRIDRFRALIDRFISIVTFNRSMSIEQPFQSIDATFISIERPL
ncbi:DDE superfamily endonuclease [Metarhizium robertsii]|uniref:DDE superfamily endonuclease n=1 Tax=Metarhizium robertsii TaxID=568076 RepID=A0A014MV36_9HYPO|nr:DDE superfamily endonuclease [Metarhizium robertsii]